MIVSVLEQIRGQKNAQELNLLTKLFNVNSNGLNALLVLSITSFPSSSASSVQVQDVTLKASLLASTQRESLDYILLLQ